MSSKYSKEELKEMAEVIMKNPMSDRSQHLLFTLAQDFQVHPSRVYQQIQEYNK